MNDQPRRTLKQLIDEYGNELVDDPRRTEALLNDLCGRHRREIFVLINAQKQHVPKNLLSAPSWLPRQAFLERLSRQLQEKLALTEDAANWAVESWAIALDAAPAQEKKPWFPFAVSRKANGEEEPPPSTSKVARNKPAKKVAARGQFDENSVNLKNTHDPALVLSPQATPNVAAARGKSQRKHQRRPWQFLRREPVSIALVWAAVFSFSLALLWFMLTGWPLFTINAGPLAALQRWTGGVTTQTINYANDAYPLPRIAWVSEGPLMVRQGPSVEEEQLESLDAGQGVKVDRFSIDGAWSYITEPVDGWVSNDFLYFLSNDEHQVAIQLNVITAPLIADNVPIYDGPGTEFNTVERLAASTEVVIIARTTDSQWYQIASPIPGWIGVAALRPAPQSTISQ